MRIALVSVALALAVAACGGDSAGNEPAQTAEEPDGAAVVTDFMKLRQQGLPADEFLSAEAKASYEEHAGGLWLYDDTLPGGPGGEYERFLVEESGAEGSLRRVVVRIHVVWDGDAEPSEMVEALTVANGKVVAATRTDDPTDEGLPSVVAQKREAIYKAGVRHDYETLETLLDPATFSYSFGEEGDPIEYWRRQEKAEIPILGDILSRVMHTRFGLNEDIYVWPSAAAKLPQDWTEADVEGMREAGYTDRDIRAFEEQVGGYAGWRVGIRADGTWLYFISGD
jgi:hypothetical protein